MKTRQQVLDTGDITNDIKFKLQKAERRNKKAMDEQLAFMRMKQWLQDLSLSLQSWKWVNETIHGDNKASDPTDDIWKKMVFSSTMTTEIFGTYSWC